MKKLAIAAALSLAAVSAHAWEVSGRGVYDWAGSNSSGGGVAISNGVKAPVVVAVKASLEMSRVGEHPWGVNQFALVATKDVAKLPLNVGVGLRAGVAYVDPVGEARVGGAAGLVGVVATLPLTKTVAVEAGLDRRFVDGRTGIADGNVGFLGLKVTF
jgi:hypothetical protein